MKKIFFIACIASSFLALNTVALDLGGLKKAASAKEDAEEKVAAEQTKVEETSAAVKDAASSPDQAALALVKAKLKTGSTKQKVREELGEPVEVLGKKEAESWLYDVTDINESYADKAEMASMVGVDVPGANKQIEVQFKSDKIHAFNIVEAASEE